MITTDLLLVHPGEVLLEEFLRPMGISQYRLALAIGVPESRINAIVKGRRTISADTDLRLCRFFGLSEGFWLRMQASHDLKLAKQALGGVLPHQAVPRCHRIGIGDARWGMGLGAWGILMLRGPVLVLGLTGGGSFFGVGSGAVFDVG